MSQKGGIWVNIKGACHRIVEFRCGSKVDSALHPSEVDKMSTSFWELSGKK